MWGVWGEPWHLSPHLYKRLLGRELVVLKTDAAPHVVLWDLPANPLIAGEPGWALTPRTSSSENHCELLSWLPTGPSWSSLLPWLQVLCWTFQTFPVHAGHQLSLPTLWLGPASAPLWPQPLPLPSISRPRGLRAQHTPQLGPLVSQQTLPISLSG